MPGMLNLGRSGFCKLNLVCLVLEVIGNQSQKEGYERKNQQKHSEENEHETINTSLHYKCNIFVTVK